MLECQAAFLEPLWHDEPFQMPSAAHDRAIEADAGDRSWKIGDVSTADHFRQAAAHVGLMPNADHPFKRRTREEGQERVRADAR